MFNEYNDFPVDEAGDIVAKGHIHHLFETERFEFRRCVEASAVERIIKREKIALSVFIFAEKIDEDRILVSSIMLCHKTSQKTFAGTCSEASSKVQLPKKFFLCARFATSA